MWILWEHEVIKSPSLQLCPERFFIKTAGKQQLHKVQQRELQSPAPGQERPQVPEQGGTAGKQLCRSSHGRPGGQQFDHKPAMCPYSKSYIRKSISSKPKEVNLLCNREVTSALLGSAFGSSVQWKHRHSRMGPVKGHDGG